MDDKLSKQDLFILMESYKNNIQLNTTLLEQQKQIFQLNSENIKKHEELCKSFEQLIEKITVCSKSLNEDNQKLKSELVTSVNSLKLDHSKIFNKIYVSMGGMILIILSIIGLAVNYSNKYEAVVTALKTIINS